MANLFLPTFNSMTYKNVAFDILTPTVVGGMFGILIIVGILAGSIQPSSSPLTNLQAS